MERFHPHELTQDADDLIKRLKRWKRERPLTRLFERRARELIVQAAEKDILEPANSLEKTQILEETALAKEQMDRLLGTEAAFVQEKVDSVTREKFDLRLRKENEEYIAEEVGIWRGQEQIISQARIGIHNAYLTLNFEGVRFNRNWLGFDRNPRITNDARFPRAAVTTFNLLVGSVTQTRFL